MGEYGCARCAELLAALLCAPRSGLAAQATVKRAPREAEGGVVLSATLRFELGPAYPAEAASVTLARTVGMAEKDVRALSAALESAASRHAGSVCMYQLVEAAQEFVTGCTLGDCPVCLDGLDEGVGAAAAAPAVADCPAPACAALGCGHAFHSACLGTQGGACRREGCEECAGVADPLPPPPRPSPVV